MRLPRYWRERVHGWAREGLALYHGVRDPRVPFMAKVALLMPVLYFIMPADLIPDVIPLLGWADDVAMFPLACWVARRMVPIGVMEELRDEAEMRLIHFGPRYRLYLTLFLAAWLLLASMGAFYFYRSFGSRKATATATATPPAANAPNAASPGFVIEH